MNKLLNPNAFFYMPKRWLEELKRTIPDITHKEAEEILIPRWQRRKELLSKRRLTIEEKKELLQ